MAGDATAMSGSNNIVNAGIEIWERRIASLRQRIDGSRVHQRIAAVDQMIDVLEERHLKGDRALDRVLRRRLHHLEEEVGLPLPRKAVRARNTVRLHAALLDWQETVLDMLLPERLCFPDVHDVERSTPTPLDV
jgi:hypothetical protein